MRRLKNFRVESDEPERNESRIFSTFSSFLTASFLDIERRSPVLAYRENKKVSRKTAVDEKLDPFTMNCYISETEALTFA